jgi:hypothetical protein
LHNAPISYHCNQAACRVIQQKQCEVLRDLHKISTGFVHNWVNYPPAINHGNGCNGTSPIYSRGFPIALMTMTPESIEIYSSWGKWWSRFEFCESSTKWRFPKMGVPPSHEF